MSFLKRFSAFVDGLNDLGNDYRYDSPDHALYEVMGGTLENPLRSAAQNSRNFDRFGAGDPKPYGAGANEVGKPGYFAANNFFNTDPSSTDNRWFVTGQIRQPEKSMYLVDSVAGEVIADEEDPYRLNSVGGPGIGQIGAGGTLEVDYRYAGDVCLMLMLDAHVESVNRFADLDELESKPRQIRVRNLDQR